MLRASSRSLLTMLLAAGVTIAVVVGLARATAPSSDVEQPTLAPRTPVVGANKGGLFGDGVTNLAKAATANWKSYSNPTYGYSFKYPADWELEETDGAGHSGPNGEPAYPLQAVKTENPSPQQGENIRGTNCQDSGCIAPAPRALGFFVSILNAGCAVPGDLVVSDQTDVNGHSAARCVIQSQFDKTTRFVYLTFPYGDGKNFIEVSLERGRNVPPTDQAILEAILSTFTITRGTAPTD
jgi:hypothetical protein